MTVEIVPDAGAAEQSAKLDALASGTAASIDLYILPHQDDELFFAPLIEQSVRQGRNPRFIYTTDGTWHGVSPAVRVRETSDVLGGMGVPANDIHQVGVERRIRDGYSYLRLSELFECITELTRDIRVRAVYVPAWEGGHADHDAAHLLGAALAREMDIGEVFECPSYTAYRAPPGLFRVMIWIPRGSAIKTRRLGLMEAARCFRMASRYRSQWRTFLGLAGPIFYRYVVRRRHECRRVGLVDYTVPPHVGSLLYERRLGVSFEQFREATSSFVALRLGPIGAPSPRREETRVA